jgi:hypothetical protein
MLYGTSVKAFRKRTKIENLEQKIRLQSAIIKNQLQLQFIMFKALKVLSDDKNWVNKLTPGEVDWIGESNPLTIAREAIEALKPKHAFGIETNPILAPETFEDNYVIPIQPKDEEPPVKEAGSIGGVSNFCASEQEKFEQEAWDSYQPENDPYKDLYADKPLYRMADKSVLDAEGD